MKEELLSVGIDLGTSTTQLVFSKIFIENMASNYSVPKMVITGKEIRYKSEIYFTPLLNQTTIDFEKIREIVIQEYKRAGIQKENIDTGAVIITGETARKENAKEVLSALSGFAGDFVVATAGPDLESIISGKGAGTDLYSKEHNITAVNIDIGGGTSNLAVFHGGETVDTGCLDVGGRLIKVDMDTREITYIAPKIQKIIEQEGLLLQVGNKVSEKELKPILDIMVQALEQSVGIRTDSKYYELLLTNHGLKNTTEISGISFSGGVAAILYEPQSYEDVFAFGDIGILLAKSIRESQLYQKLELIKSVETIRATVVGAGNHTTEISGSTITYTDAIFPLKNLPVLKLSKQEEQGENISDAIKKKLDWFLVEGKREQIAVALEGEKSPSFGRIVEYAKALLDGLSIFLQEGFPIVVVVKQDMAKVLGQAMYQLTNYEKTIVCLDSISLSEGDYIDIGKPVAGGSVLPVVVKTLVFQ